MGKKRMVKGILLLLLLIGLTMGAVAPIRYPHQTAKNWMAELEDSRSIRSLSIPGTHDSGALYSFAGLFGKCQTLGIEDQLDIGVRFLDLRLRLVGDELWVYHDFVEQKTGFDSVMATLTGFLQENPTEFLIVSIKEEGAPLRSGRVFSQTVEEALLRYPEIVSTADRLPDTVGSARGNLYILARYEDAAMGIDCFSGWESNTAFVCSGLYIQDHYKLTAAEEKYPDILAAFAAAASENYSLVLNYTSCYISGGFPPSYAGTTAQVINPWLAHRLPQTEGALGVLVCDFITSELSAAIIGRNYS